MISEWQYPGAYRFAVLDFAKNGYVVGSIWLCSKGFDHLNLQKNTFQPAPRNLAKGSHFPKNEVYCNLKLI